ncbi:PWI domain-containing protein [Trametes versicolor FP-101664 SS1]|uniref:PWI domain-containing protein n=1 Tax=Trametes versicolor (strain FP-101664) TaxID=717944 RepID=UPI00046240BB|nr:PWI domain-containing protein [Trametes versicolor FP-101664 SS1]EIW54865.1 PWI domain-containing protein [Trametes versicolor FP-101664 SS1]
MADAGFFKGTSADQDRRFSDKELKLLKTMKFPPEFEKKVDMRKVNLSVIRPWIVKKVIELVGFEDEVVVEYAMGLLEDDAAPTPDPRRMQINLTGFLTKSTPAFMSALWQLLLEAQESPAGVPRTFVEEKKAEMRQAKAGDSLSATRVAERVEEAVEEAEVAEAFQTIAAGTEHETVDGATEAGTAPAPLNVQITPTSFPASPEAKISLPRQRTQLSLPVALAHSPSSSLPLSPARGPFSLPHTSPSEALPAATIPISFAFSAATKTPSALSFCLPATRQASEGL